MTREGFFMGMHSARRSGGVSTVAGRSLFTATAAFALIGGGAGMAFADEAPADVHTSTDQITHTVTGTGDLSGTRDLSGTDHLAGTDHLSGTDNPAHAAIGALTDAAPSGTSAAG